MPTRAIAIALLIVTVLAGVLVLSVDRLTQERSALARNEDTRRSLREVPMPPYDNDPLRAMLIMPAAGTMPVAVEKVFPTRRGDDPVGVFMIVATTGYGGSMRLLVGVRYDGVVTGVRALAHRETRGFGDRVTSGASSWLQRFASRSLGDPVARRWALKGDGGDFDAVSGATVTSRAVVEAVQYCLEYYAAQRDHFFPPR
ncbi:MAG: RnfABCDGE type electron transport complex subunit G [Chromatiales bacterium]